MLRLTKSLFATSAFIASFGVAQAAPVALDDSQMDQVSAGGQYSYVEGAASAELGIVRTRANSKTIDNGHSTKTVATLRIKAVGTGLEGFGYGESGAGDQMSIAYGEASLDKGIMVIRVKTMSKVNSAGDVITASKVTVRTISKSPASVSVIGAGGRAYGSRSF